MGLPLAVADSGTSSLSTSQCSATLPGMAVAEGNLVMVHGRYIGFGPKPMIAVDIFRVANGKVAEHWDVLQEEVPASATASGNPMFHTPERRAVSRRKGLLAGRCK